MPPIDKLSLIIIRDRQVLYAKSFNKDKWFNPGGKREVGESDEQALVREIKEELSVDVVVPTLQYYGTFEAQAYAKPEGTMVRITCYTGSFEGEIKPASEIEEVKFFTSADRDLASLTGQLILDDLKEKNLID